MTADRIAELVQGRLEGDGGVRVIAIAEPESARSDEFAFLTAARIAGFDGVCGAGVLLAPAEGSIEGPAAVVRVPEPYLAAARVLEALYPEQRRPPGVDASAVVASDARLGHEVNIGAGAVVGEGVTIGDRTEIGPGCVVGAGATIGSDCLLHANVTVYDGVEIGDRVRLHAGVVLGADGFGYARDGARQVKVPQVGRVVVEDDVEIGANSCVDRGTFRTTRIGANSKIDNLVQIGHNCDVGRNCALSGLTGLAGSTILEDGVITGGNVGTAGHQRIGQGSMLAAKSGVHGDLPAGSVVGGAPHMDIGVWRRMVTALPRLPELLRRVRRLERQVQKLDQE